MVDGQVIGQIQRGLLMLLCAEQGDTVANADKMLSKLLKLRIFGDEDGMKNRSLQDLDGNGLQGGLLVVSQFTLAADVSSGNRPSFKRAASPADGQRLYDYFVTQAREAHPIVQTGQFAADMKVHLINDGPVTIPLHM